MPLPSRWAGFGPVALGLLLPGKWLEARAKRQATAAIGAPQQLRPKIAHLLSPRGESDVPAGELLVDRVAAMFVPVSACPCAPGPGDAGRGWPMRCCCAAGGLRCYQNNS